MVRLTGGALSGSLEALLEHGTAAGFTDGALVDRFLSLEGAAAERAFAVLVERHGPMVLGVCKGLLGSAHDAEDAFQSTFLVLARRARSLRSPDRVAVFLFETARRSAIKLRARRDRRRKREGPLAWSAELEPSAEGSDPALALRRREQAEAVCDEVRRLAARYRSAIVLCDLEGVTHAEAAARLGCAEGTVSARVSRGRRLLRDRLSRRGVLEIAAPLAAGGSIDSHSVAVPQAAAQTTAAAAARFAAGSAGADIISAGALSLAKDLIMSMSLAKVGVLAAGLVVGGSLIALAAPRGGQNGDPRHVASASSSGGAKPAAPARSSADSDPPQGLPGNPAAAAPEAAEASRGVASLKAELRVALIQAKRSVELVRVKAIEEGSAAEQIGRFDLVRGKVADLVDQLKEDRESLEDDLVVAQAEVELARASLNKCDRLLKNLKSQVDSVDAAATRFAQLEADSEVAKAQVVIEEAKVASLKRKISRADAKCLRYSALLTLFGQPGGPLPAESPK